MVFSHLYLLKEKKMEKHLKSLLGLTIIVVSFFVPTIEKMLVPVQPSVVQALSIEKPNEEILPRVEDVTKIVTDQQHKEEMAILNFEFARRLKAYDCKPEEMIQIWNHVARFVSDGEWAKYSKFSPVYTIEMIKEVTTDANSVLTGKEKELISERFNALSWVLGNKDE